MWGYKVVRSTVEPRVSRATTVLVRRQERTVWLLDDVRGKVQVIFTQFQYYYFEDYKNDGRSCVKILRRSCSRVVLYVL